MSREIARARILKKIIKTGPGCWLWTGATNGKKGYPKITFMCVNQYVHRLSYWAFVGQIPTKMEVCHRCDTPKCVNPDHLFLGTHQDNMSDCNIKKRSVHYTHPDCLPKGSNHQNSKLTESDVLRIRSLYSTGDHTQRALAIIYGVDRTTIGAIINRKNWGHL